MSPFINFTLYQLGWFSIVLGAANDLPWVGAGFALTLVVVHLSLVRGLARHVALVLLSGAIGSVLDSCQLAFGVLSFPTGQPVPWLVPPWDAVLWMQFATILPFSLHWLSHRYQLCCLFGAIGGPLAFYAGERLGAVSFPPPRVLHFAVLGAVWALAFPCLVWMSDRLVVESGLGRTYRFASRERDAKDLTM